MYSHRWIEFDTNHAVKNSESVASRDRDWDLKNKEILLASGTYLTIKFMR